MNTNLVPNYQISAKAVLTFNLHEEKGQFLAESLQTF